MNEHSSRGLTGDQENYELADGQDGDVMNEEDAEGLAENGSGEEEEAG
jgi:hypothetical protein